MTKQQEKDRHSLSEMDAEGYEMTPEEQEQHLRGIRIISTRRTGIRRTGEEKARKDQTIEYLTIALVAVGFFLLIIL